MSKKSISKIINKIDKFLESSDYESLDDYKKRIKKIKDEKELENEIDNISLKSNRPQSSNSTTQKQDDDAKLKFARDTYLDKFAKDDQIKASKVDAKVAMHEYHFHDSLHFFRDYFSYLDNEDLELLEKVINYEDSLSAEILIENIERKYNMDDPDLIKLYGFLINPDKWDNPGSYFGSPNIIVESLHDTWFQVTYNINGKEKVEAIQIHKLENKKERIKYLKSDAGKREICKKFHASCEPEDIDIVKVVSLGKMHKDMVMKENVDNNDLIITRAKTRGLSYSLHNKSDEFLGEFDSWTAVMDKINDLIKEKGFKCCVYLNNEGKMEKIQMDHEIKESYNPFEIVAYECNGEIYHEYCVEDASNCEPVLAEDTWYEENPICGICGFPIEEVNYVETFTDEEVNMLLGEKKNKTKHLSESDIQKQFDKLVEGSFVENNDGTLCEVRLFVSGNKTELKESLQEMAKDLSVDFELQETTDLLSYFINDEAKALIFENSVKEHFQEEIQSNILKVL